ncbi:MAG: hypothetical protein EON59_12170 [Alphaproteobacteria bacterium]|nr:MAG: hypothetical protein EON59_12170 [Alphaproteobacteria bacterium]
MGEPFDFCTPFRAAVTDIAKALGPQSAASLRLPSLEENEDFVEGSLSFGGNVVDIYWEHSLSYLCLKSDMATLEAITLRIRPLLKT